jgi:hypothetical protein
MAEADRYAKTRPREFIEALEAMIPNVLVGRADKCKGVCCEAQ